MPTRMQAARFLSQASLSSTAAEAAQVQSLGYSQWLTEQMALPRSSTHVQWLRSKGLDTVAYKNSQAGADSMVWRKLLSSPDPLRQRVTLALSEIVVVSVSGIANTECVLARPKVKAADFHGKEVHLKFRAREHQSATPCILTMTSNLDSTGVARYPAGTCPAMDPATGATLIDALGRRSYTTSIAFGPTIGKNIALAYLPHAYAEVGRELQIQYFADVYPVKVEAVGYKSLYDPDNVKPRS